MYIIQNSSSALHTKQIHKSGPGDYTITAYYFIPGWRHIHALKLSPIFIHSTQEIYGLISSSRTK